MTSPRCPYCCRILTSYPPRLDCGDVWVCEDRVRELSPRRHCRNQMFTKEMLMIHRDPKPAMLALFQRDQQRELRTATKRYPAVDGWTTLTPMHWDTWRLFYPDGPTPPWLPGDQVVLILAFWRRESDRSWACLKWALATSGGSELYQQRSVFQTQPFGHPAAIELLPEKETA